MNHPQTRSEILAALEDNAASIAELFGGIPDPAFWQGDLDRWGPAHHLEHLTQSSTAIARGLRSTSLPEHPGGHSRSYAEVRDAAAASVSATAKDRLLEMGRRAAIAPGRRRADLVRAFVDASAELRAAASRWDEQALDRRTMTHPLMGALTVREMLLFCVVHERHHQKRVRLMLAPSSSPGPAAHTNGP